MDALMNASSFDTMNSFTRSSMRRTRYQLVVSQLVTVVALLVSVATPAHAQRPAPSDSDIHALLQAAVDSNHGAGIVVGITDRSGHHIFVAGSGAPGDRDALDGRTIFEIGSVTKVFTGSLLADMVERGEVALTDPVAKFLPATVSVPARDGRQITLLDLATQSSGLPRLPTNFAPRNPADPYADYTPEQLYSFLSSYQLPRAPGAKYEYSNLGMGLLGYALALREGTTYEALLTKRILEPLHLNDTRITLNTEQSARFATGHNAAGTAVAPWSLPTLAGAGALRSTADDLLAFLDANLDTGKAPVTVALASARRLERRGAAGEPDLGLAWNYLHDAGGDIVWHNGMTGGFSSFVGIDSASHRGVVVLANTASEATDDIALHLLDERLWKARHAATARATITVPPATLDRYVGVYQLAPTFSITISRNGNSLYAQATKQQPFELFPETTTRFFLRAVNAQLDFTLTDGRVTGLVLHQNGQDTPGTKIR
jgi:serine-type D-Ala-D-Ala carboxypeptidase/endopeptidase